MGNEASTAQKPTQGQPQRPGPTSLHMRVVIRGDRKTGKTCLFNLLQRKRFAEEYTPTRSSQQVVVPSDFFIGGIPVRLEVHDVSDDAKGKSEGLKLATPAPSKTVSKKGFYEQEDDASADPQPTAAQKLRAKEVYEGAHAALFMMDPNKRWTFQWVQREVACLPSHIPALVVANFRDVAVSKDSVSLAEVKKWCAAKGVGVRFCEASMLNRFGVKAIRSFLKWPFLLMEKQYLLARLKSLDGLARDASEEFETVSREQDYDYYKDWLDRTLKERIEKAQGKQPSSGNAPAKSAPSKVAPSDPKRPPAQKPQESGGFFSKIKSIVSGNDVKPPPAQASKKKPVDPRKAIEELKKVASEASKGKAAVVDIDNFDPSAVDGDNDYDDFFGSDDDEDDTPPQKLERSAAEEEEANPWVQEDQDIDEEEFIAAENHKAAANKGFYSDDDEEEEEEKRPSVKKSTRKLPEAKKAATSTRKKPVVVDSDSDSDEEESPNPMVAGFEDIDSEDDIGNPLVARDEDISDDEEPVSISRKVPEDEETSEDEAANPLVAGDEDISDDDEANPLVAADGDISDDDVNPLVAPDEDISDEESSSHFVAQSNDYDDDDDAPNPLVAADDDLSSDGEGSNPLVAGDEDISSDSETANPVVASVEDIDSDEETFAAVVESKKTKKLPAGFVSLPDASAFSGFAASASSGGGGGDFFAASSSADTSSFFGDAEMPEHSTRMSRSSGDVRLKRGKSDRRERSNGRNREGRGSREGREGGRKRDPRDRRERVDRRDERRERDPNRRRQRPPREEADEKKVDPSVYML